MKIMSIPACVVSISLAVSNVIYITKTNKLIKYKKRLFYANVFRDIFLIN